VPALSVAEGVGVGVGVLAGLGVGVAVAIPCRVERHPANRLAIAASLMNSRLEIPCGEGLALRLCSLVIGLSFCLVDRIEKTLSRPGQRML